MNSQARFAFHLLRNPTQIKHIFRWRESLTSDYFLTRRQPWLAFDAIDYLNSLQLVGKYVFEYGSGGSTLFWCEHGAQVTSIEHDETWYRMLRDHYLGSAVLDYRLVLPEPATWKSEDYANPNAYVSADVNFQNFSFKEYCSQIDEFPDQFFDVVLIDGRARPSCIKHSSRKVKEGGVLVVDNSDRDYYLQQTSALLPDYERKVFFGATPGVTWFTETSVYFRKPN